MYFEKCWSAADAHYWKNYLRADLGSLSHETSLARRPPKAWELREGGGNSSSNDLVIVVVERRRRLAFTAEGHLVYATADKKRSPLSLSSLYYIYPTFTTPPSPLSTLVGPLAPLMVRKEPLYYTLYIYIYCCWRSPLVLPQPSFLSFSPQKSMFSTYIGCPEKIGTDLLPYIVLYVGISLDSLSNCTTYKCVGVQMPFRPCHLWDTRNKYYICSDYDLIYMKFCFEVVCIIHVSSTIVALSFMKSKLYPLCFTYCWKIQI